MVRTVLVFLTLICLSRGEPTGSVHGRVGDARTGDPLLAANVLVRGLRMGAYTDGDGRFEIWGIPTGPRVLEVSMVGYETRMESITVTSGGDLYIEFELGEEMLPTPDVVVTAERMIEKTSVSAQALPGEDLKDLQGLMEDPVHSIMSLPGVCGSSFGAWVSVRGGSPIENLWLLDWVPVYWPFHFGGMKSVFNSEMVKNIELYTGGFPAKYGDRLSSVVNISTRDGCRERYKGKVNLSLINALGLLEGPIGDDASFILSARRSYYDLILTPEEGFTIPSFYDIQGNLAWDVASGHKLLLSGLLSGEYIRAEFEDPEPEQPSKLEDRYLISTSSLQWKWLISENFYSMAALIFQTADIKMEMDRWWMRGTVKEPGVRYDITWRLDGTHEVKTGLEVRRPDLDWETFLPLSPEADAWFDTTAQAARREAKGTYTFVSGYLQDTWDLFPGLTLAPGLRYERLDYTGKGELSPRLSARFRFDDRSAIRLAYGHFHQIPEIEELIENPDLETKLATHKILGLEREFGRDIRGWVEVYDKDYRDLIIVDSLGNYSNGGFGNSYGAEVFLQRKGRGITGWISYSLSWSKRREYVDESEIPFRYDRRHDLTLVFNWRLGRTWRLSAKWRMASGFPYTPVVAGIRDDEGHWIEIDGGANSARYPLFHRLDVKVEKTFRFLGLNPIVYVEVLNAYARKNVSGYEYSFTESGEPIPDPYYGLPILPTLGISVEF
jgi:hypothetical protein